MTNETLGAASAGPALLRAIGPRLLLFVVIGDMLGTGIYALTGDVAGQVGGAAWLAFGGAFIVAMFTATSYLELVGKYPRAAGAALYVQQAFDSRFITFLVAFAVMESNPSQISVGKVSSVPPAATAFMVPAMTPTMNATLVWMTSNAGMKRLKFHFSMRAPAALFW